jgi:hypothetical protein
MTTGIAAFVHAQTNLQLFAQLRAAGYGEDDLARIRAAYEIAMHLFAGCFRASGRTFLAHLVGTASVLATTGARPTLVAAALVHAAYTHGNFGAGRGLTDRKRARLRGAVGDEVEALVAAYTTFAWYGHIQDTLVRLPTLGPWTRDVAVMRLANDLDDHLHLGLLYESGKSWGGDREPEQAACVALAHQLGLADLADALAAVFAETARGTIEPACRPRHRFLPGAGVMYHAGRDSSFVLPPLSHRRRLLVEIRYWARKLAWARRLYRRLRRHPPG